MKQSCLFIFLDKNFKCVSFIVHYKGLTLMYTSILTTIVCVCVCRNCLSSPRSAVLETGWRCTTEPPSPPHLFAVRRQAPRTRNNTDVHACLWCGLYNGGYKRTLRLTHILFGNSNSTRYLTICVVPFHIYLCNELLTKGNYNRQVCK